MILIIQNSELAMSKLVRPLGKRLVRWLLITSCLGTILLALAGRWDDPWLWGYLLVFAAAGLYPSLYLDDDLAKERFHPPEPGADRVPLKWIRLLALVHIVVGALDARWQISPVPESLRTSGLIGMALALALVYRAMMANRFFSSVVRIQRDRGHRVIDRDVYSVIRHPGYAGMIPAMPFSALALGSWIAFAIGLAYSLMMVRRVLFEDAFLREHLDGYPEYSLRVRYRLIPGVW
jgi:protein-S-isoprenylcysteine O-methyltransferase Ste14